MELTIEDSEFLNLFLPESSPFTTEEILEEFKIYIFRMMNLSVDSLIQEQVPNKSKLDQQRVRDQFVTEEF